MIGSTQALALEILTILSKRWIEKETDYIGIEKVLPESFPIPYCKKVARHLRSMGYVQTQRGVGGGIRLCVPPKQISVKKVLDILGPSHHHVGMKAAAKVEKVMDKYTLQTLSRVH